MKPVLFTIGPFNVYTFGVFLALAFILSTFIIWKFGRDELREEEYLDAYLMMSVVSLISGRLVYILFHGQAFGFNVLKYILVRETPGLSIIGGMVGGFVYLLYFIRKKKYLTNHILDLFSIAAVFSMILAKIGEQLGGASYGKETDFVLGIKVIGLSGRRHPVELYESVMFGVIAVILVYIYNNIRRRKWPDGLAFYSFVFLVATTIFLLEFMKLETLYLYGLSIKQIIVLTAMFTVIKPLFDRIKSVRIKTSENKI